MNQISGKEVKSLRNGEPIGSLALGVMMKREVSEIKKAPLRLNLAHVRQSIRDNVFHSQVFPLGTNKLSTIYIFTESEILEYSRLDQVRKSTLL